MSTRRVGIWLVGALGGVGATATLGLAALKRGLTDGNSLTTALPLFAGLDLDPVENFTVGGHEIRNATFNDAVRDLHEHAAVFDAGTVAGCREQLDAWQANVRPGTILGAGPTISKLADLPGVDTDRTPAGAIERLKGDIRQFKEANQLDQVVVVCVASTEPPFELGETHQTLAKLKAALDKPDCPLPASSLYAYAALDLGLPFVNFTPSLGASFPALHELAALKKAPIAGQDGKTGETLMKSVLAPMFAHRNWQILSWVGHNIFGNRDGIVLDDPSNKASKIKTKDQVITQIVGYKPATHVSIEYIPSMDDWKTAWDHIHFKGFLGTKMILQFIWQGCAAGDRPGPARPVRPAARRGRRAASPGVLLQESQRRRRTRFLRPVGDASRVCRGAHRGEGVEMKLAFSTNAYLRFPFAEAVRRIAGLGYEGVEIMADVPHAWPAYLLDEQKAALRDALAKNRLGISNINSFMMHAVNDRRQKYWHPSWIEPDPNYRAIRIDHTMRALTLAKELGARCVTTEPGGPVAPGESWQAALKLFVEMVKPVAEHADKEGVLLLIEPEPGLLIETCDQFLEFMQHMDSPAVGLNYDIGHAFCVKDDPATTIPRVASHIRHFHLEDIAATRVHHHMVPGEGAIDFKATLAAIRSIGYDGWLTVELYPYVENPDEAARKAREVLLPLI